MTKAAETILPVKGTMTLLLLLLLLLLCLCLASFVCLSAWRLSLECSEKGSLGHTAAARALRQREGDASILHHNTGRPRESRRRYTMTFIFPRGLHRRQLTLPSSEMFPFRLSLQRQTNKELMSRDEIFIFERFTDLQVTGGIFFFNIGYMHTSQSRTINVLASEEE